MPRHNRVLNKKKIKENADKIKEHFQKYNIVTCVKNHEVSLVITNTNVNNRNIKICFNKDEIIFYFSYQHAHFYYNDLRGLIEYIDSFLTNQIAAIEFFEGDRDCCGGSRKYSCIDITTAETIASLFVENKEHLLLAFQNNLWKFYVQGWEPSKDKAVAILWDGCHYSIAEIDR